MTRTLTALFLGLLLGVAVTWLLLRPSPPSAPARRALGSAVPTMPPSNAVVSTAAREGGSDFYRRLAEAGATELAAMIAQAASEPASTDRELALAVLLNRYSELDAAGAVRLAREARIGGMALSTAYGAWARMAPGQALAALSTVDSADAATDVALALIAALGNDAAAVNRVAAVLAAREGETPFGSVVPPNAPMIAPAGPFAFVPTRSALGLTAERWAEVDAGHALAVAREVDDERLRLMLEAAALRSLARTAPDEAFGHFETLGDESRPLGVLSGALAELARADPERLLTAASGMPAEIRRIAESAGLQQLADRDPLAALRHVERMPAGAERRALTQLVARGYGKRDADAALAWARSQPGQPNLVAAVIGGVAEQDPIRAVDLALDLDSPVERMRAVQFVAMGARDDATAEAVATRVLTVDNSSLRDSLAPTLISMWAARSPDSAMRWLLANGQDMPNTFMQAGQQLAMRDPRNAVAYTVQVPPAAREPWIHGVAQGYAQNDPQGAVDWVGQFRGEPWYERAATTLAMSVAQRDGPAAARLVDQLDPDRIGPQAQQLASVIAASWANHDPAAAAEWAIDRPTEPQRAVAVRNVLGAWSAQDPDGARQWTLRLPQGATRDGALTMLLTATAYRTPGGLDARVLNAFASETARQQAVLQVVQGLAAADLGRARAIADTHLADAALRAQAERALEAARNGTGRPQAAFGVSDVVSPAPLLRAR